MPRDFTPTKTFFSAEAGSEYVAGMGYTAADDNKKLNGLVDKWIAEGKVTLGRPAAATVKGKAKGKKGA